MDDNQLLNNELKFADEYRRISAKSRIKNMCEKYPSFKTLFFFAVNEINKAALSGENSVEIKFSNDDLNMLSSDGLNIADVSDLISGLEFDSDIKGLTISVRW